MTLCEVRDRPAINLQIESEIPSEVRDAIHDEVTRREMMIRPIVIRRGTALRNSADKTRAHKSENQKNLAGEAAS